ncbi:MAG: hypothetical protein ACKVU2_01985 [Saprospiraceae bacterium]
MLTAEQIETGEILTTVAAADTQNDENEVVSENEETVNDGEGDPDDDADDEVIEEVDENDDTETEEVQEEA